MIPRIHLSIANRLRLGFGLLIVMIMVIAFTGMRSVDRLHQGTNQLAGDAWPRIRQAVTALDSARQSMNDLGQSAAAPAVQVRAAGMQGFERNLAKVDQALGQLELSLTDPQATALLANTKQRRDAYVAVAMQVRQLAGADRRDEARALAFGPATVALQAFAATLALQVSLQERQFHGAAEQANTIFADAVKVVGGTEAAAVLLALIAAVMITRSVVLPLRRAVEVASVIATGDLTGEIETGRNDEAGLAPQLLAIAVIRNSPGLRQRKYAGRTHQAFNIRQALISVQAHQLAKAESPSSRQLRAVQHPFAQTLLAKACHAIRDGASDCRTSRCRRRCLAWHRLGLHRPMRRQEIAPVLAGERCALIRRGHHRIGPLASLSRHQ
eukprot:gene21170-25432_t